MKKIIFLILCSSSMFFPIKSQGFGFEFGVGGGDYSGPGFSFAIGAPYYDPYYDIYPVYEDEYLYYE